MRGRRGSGKTRQGVRMGLAPNTLHSGDRLERLSRFPSGSDDLIRLDPPFGSHQGYSLLPGNGAPKRNGGRSAQVRAFDDTWRRDDAAARRMDRIARRGASGAPGRRRAPHADRRGRDAGLPPVDGGEVGRDAPRPEADGERLPAWRPDGRPGAQASHGPDLRTAQRPVGNRLETHTAVAPVRASGAHAVAAGRRNLRMGATGLPRARSIHVCSGDRMPVRPALAESSAGKPVQGSLRISL